MIEKIDNSLKKLQEHFKSGNPEMSDKERVFSRVIKLNEEVGELCEAILYENDKNQRSKDKVIDVDEEIADVLICTLLLAKTRKKDIWKEVDSKLEKIFTRLDIK
jgi:NTP pyrophosphatase (non-canonical NTP hydrolase)